MAPKKTDQLTPEQIARCRAHALDRYAINSNEHIQIEPDAPVRTVRPDELVCEVEPEAGAYVQAWVWVPIE